MERALTADQKNVSMALEELVKTPWRKIVEEYINANIKKRENILLGKEKVEINLDEIKFSQSTVIRWELAMLYNIVEYPNSYTKKLWIIKG